MQAAREGTAEHRQDAHVRPVDLLEEYDLQLHGVFEGVAEILHHRGLSGGARQPFGQRGIGGAFAQRGDERFARQPEALRLPVVGGRQDDEGAVAVLRTQQPVGGAVGLPASLQAHVRGRDPHQAVGRGWRRAGAVQVARQRAPQLLRFRRVGRSGVRRRAHGRLRELALAPGAHAGVDLVFQEAALAQGADQLVLELRNVQASGQPHQLRAQVQLRLPAVEQLQAADQRRRNDHHGIGVMVGVADKQSRPVLDRRGHEVQVGAQAG